MIESCIHEHNSSCYPAETSGVDGSSFDAEEKQPTECSHTCSEESGCVTKELDCHHEHDGSCGYQEEIPGSACTFVCEICSGTASESGKTPGAETEETNKSDAGQEECICEEPCKEGNVNTDCPVCGAEGASLSDCKGKNAEKNAGDAEENAGKPEDTGLCKHHPEHDDTCGYLPESEDSEGNPCTYKCRICPVEELIAVLPDAADITEDNADKVRAQLEEILALYRELTEDEQEQIDLSRCYELQEALDEANDPDPVEGEISADYQEAAWDGSNSKVTYATKTAENCTVVADSAEAVTWTAGWYAVNGTVTISEPITVSGNVSLILTDGCTLNAEQGIVVTDGNNLTIYA